MSHAEDAMNARAKPLIFVAFGASLAVHGLAYASLASGDARPHDARPSVSLINFELPEPAPAVVPTPSRAPEAAPERPRAPSARNAAAPEPKPQAPLIPPSPSPSPTLDLSGITLSNDSGQGFAMPLGNGSPLHGAIGLGTAGTGSGSPAAAPAAPALEGPPLVRVQDLSEHPRPPALEGLLRQNYPAEARQRGLRGTARVRARIDPDGVIRRAHVLEESGSGFGLACQRTVLGSRWSAPRGQNGAAVATEIVYTCHFEVDG